MDVHSHRLAGQRSLLVTLTLFSLLVGANAQVTYVNEVIYSEFNSSRNLVPSRINDQGFICGNADNRPFRFIAGQMQWLGLPPNTQFARAYEINDSGDVCGIAWNQADYIDPTPVVWRNDTIIPTTLVVPGNRYGKAVAINSHGTVVGTTLPLIGEYAQGIIWKDGGTPKLYPNIDYPGFPVTMADVNDGGDVVGTISMPWNVNPTWSETRFAVWNADDITNNMHRPFFLVRQGAAYDRSSQQMVNNLKQFAGQNTTVPGYFDTTWAVFYGTGSTFTNLLSHPGLWYSDAWVYDFNDLNQIICGKLDVDQWGNVPEFVYAWSSSTGPVLMSVSNYVEKWICLNNRGQMAGFLPNGGKLIRKRQILTTPASLRVEGATAPTELEYSLSIKASGTPNVIETTDVAPSPTGTISEQFDLGIGSYDIAIDTRETPRQWIRNVPITTTLPPLSFNLKLGDVDGDEEIGPGDFEIVVQNFGSGTATFEEGDVDGDGEVGPSDFEIIVANFGIGEN